MNPVKHSEMCARKWGGKWEDYYDINAKMDETKGIVSSNIHRFVWHSSYGSSVLVPLVFGPSITNSDGKVVSTKDIAEYHILADFGMKFIPTLQDYANHMEIAPWMCGIPGEYPESYKNMKRPKNLSTTSERVTDEISVTSSLKD